MGRTETEHAWLALSERSGRPASVADGSASAGGRIWGCYLHGLFGNLGPRQAWLSSLGWQSAATDAGTDHLIASLDRLADIVEQALDMGRLEQIWES